MMDVEIKADADARARRMILLWIDTGLLSPSTEEVVMDLLSSEIFCAALKTTEALRDENEGLRKKAREVRDRCAQIIAEEPCVGFEDCKGAMVSMINNVVVPQ